MRFLIKAQDIRTSYARNLKTTSAFLCVFPKPYIFNPRLLFVGVNTSKSVSFCPVKKTNNNSIFCGYHYAALKPLKIFVSHANSL